MTKSFASLVVKNKPQVLLKRVVICKLKDGIGKDPPMTKKTVVFPETSVILYDIVTGFIVFSHLLQRIISVFFLDET